MATSTISLSHSQDFLRELATDLDMWLHVFCFVKKKKTLDLQVFCGIGKTMKSLKGIPNTKVNISDGVETVFSTHRLGNI